MKSKVGAPKGGRVHWLLWNLPKEFKGAYILQYDYKRHNYIFYRMDGRRLYDIFIVAQTSKHYWRCTYACLPENVYEFFGSYTTRIIAEIMTELYYEYTDAANGVHT